MPVNIPDTALLITYDGGGLIDTVMVRGDINSTQAYRIAEAMFPKLDLRHCKHSNQDMRPRSSQKTAVEDQYGTTWFCFAVLIKPIDNDEDEDEEEENG